MVIGIRNLQWLDHNAQRRYPLVGDATRYDDSATLELPDNLLVSLYFPIDFSLSVDPTKFFLKTLVLQPAGAQIVIGYSGSGGDIDVASALVPSATHEENSTYSLIGIGDYADSRGHVVVGSLEGLEGQPAGQFEFSLTATRLEPETIRPSIRTVPSLKVQNGEVLSDLTGRQVVLQAGRNTRFRVVTVSGQPTRIIFDAIEGEGLTETCVCDDGLSAPIRTVESVGPDGSGNLRLLGNDCLEVNGVTNGLQLDDVCSEPCCGCKELEAVTSALEAFGSRATTLENTFVRLEAQVTKMDLVVLGSRLGDRGCTPAQDCP